MICLARRRISGALDPAVLSGNSILEPQVETSIRVDYGGFHLGLGIFALLGVAKLGPLRPALMATSITMSLVLVTRLIGTVVDGFNSEQLAILGFESPRLFCLFLA